MRILVDTREKVGYWTFVGKDIPIIHTGLKTGDYTIEGHEDILCIERKKSVAEIAQNINQKRFTDELKRMQEYKWAYIICEFGLGHILDFPNSADLPPRIKAKIRINGSFILKRISEIMTDYHIPFLFCTNKYYAEEMAFSIMKRVINDGKR